MKFKYSDEEFTEAVRSSKSIRQCLSKLGLKAAGGSYKSFYNTLNRLNLDKSHFTGKVWNKGKRFPFKRPITDYLSNKQTIQSFKLRNRLLKEGIFKRQCSNCNRTEWLGNEIPIKLDHINGNPDDNSLANLRLLCPNCHALTPTYRGKNKRKR